MQEGEYEGCFPGRAAAQHFLFPLTGVSSKWLLAPFAAVGGVLCFQVLARYCEVGRIVWK